MRFLSSIAKDAKDTYAGLDEERLKGKLDELLELINAHRRLGRHMQWRLPQRSTTVAARGLA